MSTIPIERTLPAPRFSPIDTLMVSLWAAMLFLAALIPNMHFMLGSFLAGGVLIGRHVWSVVYRGETRDGNLELAVLLPVFGVFSSAAFTYVTRATPVTYDALLAKWDMGFAPMVRGWALLHPWVMDPAVWAYRGLPISILLVLVTTTGRIRSRLVWSLYLGACLSLPCYLLFPVVGPIHAPGGIADPSGPRNCMPSMHLTWTLLLWLNASGWMKWAAGIFAALTAIATPATGEHCHPDLIAALPWTCLITFLACKFAK